MHGVWVRLIYSVSRSFRTLSKWASNVSVTVIVPRSVFNACSLHILVGRLVRLQRMGGIIENINSRETSLPSADSCSPAKLSEIYFSNEFWRISDFDPLTSSR